MSLKIERLSSKFVLDVVRIESELIAKTSAESVEKTISSNYIHYFVLLEEDEVCGFLECSIIAPESELFEIAIDKKFQGRGFSKTLMDFYLNFANQNGCDTIFLEVNNMNMKALNLYRKYGFSEYGKRKNYYGENQDAILMKRMI